MSVTGAKNWLTSKTVLANGGVFLAGVFIVASKVFDVNLGGAVDDVDTNTIVTGGVLTVANFILRWITTQPITTE